MSYSVKLIRNGEPVSVSQHQIGGTIKFFGSSEAEMTITYNLSEFFEIVFPNNEGLRWLDGKYAYETTDVLKKGVKRLGVKPPNDPWASRASNAGYYLDVLYSWAMNNPDAEWRVY